MYYYFELQAFPKIRSFYTVERNTIWQISEKNNVLVFIKNGVCELSCDGETYTVNKGDIFFIPANHFYTRKPVGNSLCTMTYLHFDVNDEITSESKIDLANTISQIKNNIDTKILSGETNLSYPKTIYIQNKNSLNNFDEIFSMLNSINLFSAHRQLMCNMQSSIVLCTILASISQGTINGILADNSIKCTAKIPANLKKAISYIAKHHCEKITLDDLSAYCNTSKQQIIRYFKSAFKTTPIKYIIEYKLSKAKEMLFYHPELTIKEIAAELGFDNQHYFTRIFIKFNNESPSNFRDRTINYRNAND